MKRFAKITWWCSLALTLFMVGCVFYPFFPFGGGWGEWKKLVGLEVPAGELKRVDLYGNYNGGSEITWFLCRVDEDWLQRCINRFSLKIVGNTYSLDGEDFLQKSRSFTKWRENSDVSCWTKMEGGPFLWQDGRRPSYKNEKFAYRVSLLFSPDRKKAILKLKRGFFLGNETVLPLDIAAGGESWLTTMQRNVLKFLFLRFPLVIIALGILVPCLLVWLPVLARVRKFPQKTGKMLEVGYYAGTAVASFLYIGCGLIHLGKEDDVSLLVFLFSVISLPAVVLMLFIAWILLSREKARSAQFLEIPYLPRKR
ncbi:hypothetical protein [Akkermansia sp.]|uniref:hypothetical protein n=1 Tax=Akkermansia sp. TaxID=1872421 RepID=UPI0025C46E66|nr:hypothetical protein [Akkermansia sp.]MCC8148949.1 hypothetical protein [Akkermansia sp.]